MVKTELDAISDAYRSTTLWGGGKKVMDFAYAARIRQEYLASPRFKELFLRFDAESFSVFDSDGGRLNSFIGELVEFSFDEYMPKLVSMGAPMHAAWNAIFAPHVQPPEVLRRTHILLSLGVSPDGAGYCVPLQCAGAKPGYLPVLRVLLEAGANPVLKPAWGEPPMLRARQLNPEGAALLREYARPYLVKKRGAALHTRSISRAYDLPESVGVMDFLHPLESVDYSCSVVLVRAAPEFDVAGEIAARIGQCEVERDYRKRLAEYADRGWWVLRLRGYEWTIVVHDAGRNSAGGPFVSGDLVHEYAPRLSAHPSVDAVVYLEHGALQEWRGGEVTLATSEPMPKISIEELKRIVAAGESIFKNPPASFEEARQQREEVDQMCRERRILLPRLEANSDGYFDTVTIWGVKKPDIVLLDRIVWTPPPDERADE
ncbi:MAG: hypothetical protein GXP55_09650 [Deltaproteobacteria bacterium]|nr:hypothetical protein [Deltaproteobacteria bacterium]